MELYFLFIFSPVLPSFAVIYLVTFLLHPHLSLQLAISILHLSLLVTSVVNSILLRFLFFLLVLEGPSPISLIPLLSSSSHPVPVTAMNDY